MGITFSPNHRAVAVRYALASAFFLFAGFGLVALLRWQLAYPGAPIPWLGTWLGDSRAPGGIMLPEFYNQLTTMHGTVMVFLGVVPLAFGAFGNFLIPLQIGSADMAFPRLNAATFWVFLAGGLTLLASFLVPGGAANSGWTAYPPLADIASSGQSWWLVGVALVIAASLIQAVVFIVTIVQLRAPGMWFFRLPFFVWTELAASLLFLFAAPPLVAAAIFQLMDRWLGASFFLPAGLLVDGRVLPVAGGGDPLLWQYLFWFLGHPEVYVLILPPLGIVAEVLTCHMRRPLFGYPAMVMATLLLAVLSLLVWAHHMFLVGLGPFASGYFQAATIFVSMPSVAIITCLLLSLWGGAIRFTVPMLFALAFLPMFGIGGLTGLPLALAITDVHLHDTYYVVGHFHYVVGPGILFALFAGIYHWFPRLTGRRLHHGLGVVHFAGSFVCMNVAFMPMMFQGLAGMNRRLYDGGASYLLNQNVLYLHEWISVAAWILALFQFVLLFNIAWSLRRGEVAEANPWLATTLEWGPRQAPLSGAVMAHRPPYEYHARRTAPDFTPQFEADAS
ncbi:MAG: cbb3-type cytochrome c oxidase subunit I [Vicinamibacterales bacterium]